MDLESESSALESIGDNGLNQQNTDHDGRSLDNGSWSDESVKLVSTSTRDETSVESGKPLSFVDSQGGGFSPVSKGRGLRKWRRIRRDLVKDTPGNMENSKVLKRGLSGLAHSHGKQQMQFQSPDVELDSQGSVGSVNMLKVGGDGFGILGYDSRFIGGVDFAAGVDSEKDDDRSSKSSTAGKASKVIRYEKKPVISSGQRGKSRVDNGKKHRGESVDMEKENSHSSFDYETRKHVGENGDEANRNGERKDDVGGEERFSEDLDPLAIAIDGFFTLQEAFEKEVQQFREIGRDQMPQHHEVDSPHQEIVTLVNSVEQLEIKLKETRSMLEAKESYIHELESTTNQNKHSWGGTESVVEDIFRQRIEAEIEYLIYSRSIDNLNIQMKVIEEEEALAGEQADKMLNKLGDVETKAADLANRAQDLEDEHTETEITGTDRKRACKTTSYLVIQIVLLLIVAFLFISQLFPESEIVIPT